VLINAATYNSLEGCYWWYRTHVLRVCLLEQQCKMMAPGPVTSLESQNHIWSRISRDWNLEAVRRLRAYAQKVLEQRATTRFVSLSQIFFNTHRFPRWSLVVGRWLLRQPFSHNTTKYFHPFSDLCYQKSKNYTHKSCL
jgi:hypothetical protein